MFENGNGESGEEFEGGMSYIAPMAKERFRPLRLVKRVIVTIVRKGSAIELLALFIRMLSMVATQSGSPYIGALQSNSKI
jgi:hypothetical protein